MNDVKKPAHILLTALVSLYLTLVFLVRPAISTALLAQDGFYLMPPLLTGAAFFALCYGLLHLASRRVKTLFTHASERTSLSPALFLGVSACVFVFYVLYLLSEYPGGFSPDTKWQWEQAHTLAFNDHHPFFHTLLFWLLTRIWDSYTFLLLVQIAALSLGFGYLAASMRAWGFRLPLILPVCFAGAFSFATRSIALFCWKDTALSIFCLYLLPHLFHMVLTRGEWLQKPGHRIAFGVLIACITLVRHNAVLFTAPLLVLLPFAFPRTRRAALRVTALVVALVIGVKGPLQSLCNVESAPSTYLETTGLPMTVLCSAYALAPETMPQDALALMQTIAPQEAFAQTYQFGDYNSVKWAFDLKQEHLSALPLPEFLGMTLRTAAANPMLALRSVLELTAMVWDPSGERYALSVPPYGEPPEYVPLPGQVQVFFEQLFQLIDGAFNGVIYQKLTSQLGILTVVLLLALYLSIHRFRGWTALWLAAPVLCYNFGTMLLLCGPDFRFFHFNVLIVWPLTALLASKPAQAQSETCK